MSLANLIHFFLLEILLKYFLTIPLPPTSKKQRGGFYWNCINAIAVFVEDEHFYNMNK